MTDMAHKFWRSRELLGSAPYPERADIKPNWADRLALSVMGTAGAHLPFRRRALERRALEALKQAGTYRDYGEAALAEEVQRMRARLLREGFRDDTVSTAAALVREVSRRALGLEHFKVQLMGAMAMLDGALVEMATGEGKTLTGSMTAALAALAGLPTHVVTVNDYLATRDAEKLGPIYRALGLTLGVVTEDMDPPGRALAYAADVTYVTNKTVVFDYLRDRIALKGLRSGARVRLATMIGDLGGDSRKMPLMLRGLHFALIDEADSIFIDEARTPLIISSELPPEDGETIYHMAIQLAGRLIESRDYEILRGERSPRLHPAGRMAIAQMTRGLGGLWGVRRAREELIEQSLSALHLFDKDRHYIVVDGKVQIVDEFTGRVMADRSWEGGLHQMIEAKEGVELTGKRETLARITYQRMFRRYRRLAGMSGTVLEMAGELHADYDLKTVRIPTNRPIARKFLGVRMFATSEQRWQAVAERVREVACDEGRPVLVGTRSVEASELLSRLLAERDIAHVVLNARQDADEADIVARAGQAGQITVTTNMAGRGTDIQLGPGIADRGGLHVILTEFHESSRIDRQLYGRAGRQGDPGSCEAIVCLEDELFERYARVLQTLVRRTHAGQGEIRPQRIVTTLQRFAQMNAEHKNAIIRREQVRLDRQLDKALAFSGLSE